MYNIMSIRQMPQPAHCVLNCLRLIEMVKRFTTNSTSAIISGRMDLPAAIFITKQWLLLLSLRLADCPLGNFLSSS